MWEHPPRAEIVVCGGGGEGAFYHMQQVLDEPVSVLNLELDLNFCGGDKMMQLFVVIVSTPIFFMSAIVFSVCKKRFCSKVL